MYLSKNMFNLVSIAVDLDTILKLFSTERTGEIGGVINEKHGVGDVVFLAQLGEKFSPIGIVYVGESRAWRILFVSGLTAAYRQYSSSLTRIDFWSTATRSGLSPPAGCKSAFCTQL